jgi:hypothetical protein
MTENIFVRNALANASTNVVHNRNISEIVSEPFLFSAAVSSNILKQGLVNKLLSVDPRPVLIYATADLSITERRFVYFKYDSIFTDSRKTSTYLSFAWSCLILMKMPDTKSKLSGFVSLIASTFPTIEKYMKNKWKIMRLIPEAGDHNLLIRTIRNDVVAGKLTCPYPLLDLKRIVENKHTFQVAMVAFLIGSTNLPNVNKEWLQTSREKIFKKNHCNTAMEKDLFQNLMGITEFSIDEWNDMREVILSTPLLMACMIQGLFDLKITAANKNSPAEELLIFFSYTDMTHTSIIQQAYHLSSFIPKDVNRSLNHMYSFISLYEQSI